MSLQVGNWSIFWASGVQDTGSTPKFTSRHEELKEPLSFCVDVLTTTEPTQPGCLQAFCGQFATGPAPQGGTLDQRGRQAVDLQNRFWNDSVHWQAKDCTLQPFTFFGIVFESLKGRQIHVCITALKKCFCRQVTAWFIWFDLVPSPESKMISKLLKCFQRLLHFAQVPGIILQAESCVLYPGLHSRGAGGGVFNLRSCHHCGCDSGISSTKHQMRTDMWLVALLT